MQMKGQVEWAIHCCSVLAHMPAGRFVATRTLAEFHKVPKEYLSKALQALSQAGLIEGTLGPTGGYRLARPADEITFLDIVEAVEGDQRAFHCTEIRANNPCLPEGTRYDRPCGIARIMWEAEDAWRDRLRAARLSDLVASLQDELPEKLRADTDRWFADR